MDIVAACPDLAIRIRRLLNTAIISPTESRKILRTLMTDLNVSPSLANLFAPAGPLPREEYIKFVIKRSKEFADEEEEADNTESDQSTTLKQKMKQTIQGLNDWKAKMGLTKSNHEPVAEEPSADADEPDPTELLTKLGRKLAVIDKEESNQSDSEDLSSENSDAEDPEDFCDRLLQDVKARSEFSKKCYSLVNPSGTGGVPPNRLTPLYLHLYSLGFDKMRVQEIARQLEQGDFLAYSTYNYPTFSAFLHKLLRTYSTA